MGLAVGVFGIVLILCGVWVFADNRMVLTERNVVGTWRAHDGAEIVLRSDHAFTAHRLAARFFPSFYEGSARRSGEGIWSLQPSRADSDGPTTQLVLDFKNMSGVIGQGPSIPMIGDREDGSMVLFVFIGDPDLNVVYSFSKVSS
jgi:hypothetical protein